MVIFLPLFPQQTTSITHKVTRMKRLLLLACIPGMRPFGSALSHRSPLRLPMVLPKTQRNALLRRHRRLYENRRIVCTFYWKESESKLLIEIEPEQFNTLYLCSITRQSGDAYLFDRSSQIANFPSSSSASATAFFLSIRTFPSAPTATKSPPDNQA